MPDGRKYAMSRTVSTVREYLACTGPDYLGEVETNDLSMEVGVGPARYGDLNSDLPVCITQDFLLIQLVTSLTFGTRLYVEPACSPKKRTGCMSQRDNP